MSTYTAINRIPQAMMSRVVAQNRDARLATFRGIGKRVMGETTTYYKLRAPAPTTTGYHEWYNTTGDDTGKPSTPATTGPTVIVERFQVRAYAAPPAIVSASGTTYAGGVVVVTGQEFREGMRFISDTVLLGTTTVTSKNTASVVVPPGAPVGTHTLVAAHMGGNSGSSGVGLLQVTASTPPTLARVQRQPLPASTAALASGGDVLGVVGAGFYPGSQLEVDGTLINAAFAGSTFLMAPAPAHAEGTVNCRVRNPDGTFSATQPLTFVANPTSLYIPGFWEQRGDSGDYNAAAATKRPGRATSDANAATRAMNADGNLPTAGAVVDGITSLRFAANDRLMTGDAAPAFNITLDAHHVGALVKVDAVQPTALTGALADPSIINEGYSPVSLTAGPLGTTAGPMRFGSRGYEAASSSSRQDLVPADVTSWHFVEVRHAGGLLQISVDNGPWSAGVACGSLNSVAYQITAGHYRDLGVTTPHDQLAMFAAGVLSDTNRTRLYKYLKLYRYPSAGLP